MGYWKISSILLSSAAFIGQQGKEDIKRVRVIDRMKRFKFVKKFCVMFYVLLFLSIGSLSAAAAEAQKKGFVEYQTEASINFNEIIEVVLTDKETGYYYTHNLYRVNDYTANPSMPFGTYTVGAQVISDTGSDTAQYSVVCSDKEIIVNNVGIAVPIKLKIEIFSEFVTTTSDYSDIVQGEESSVAISSVRSDDELTNTSFSEKKDENYLLFSSLFFLGFILLLVIGYWLYKRKFEKE